MKSFDYLLEKYRMIHTGVPEGNIKCDLKECSDCPLSNLQNGTGMACRTLENRAPKIAIDIMKHWSETHPIQTRLDYLLERFPDTEMHTDPGDTVDLKYPQVCAKALGIDGVNCDDHINCYDCWNTAL